jgi:hypothetical protein
MTGIARRRKAGRADTHNSFRHRCTEHLLIAFKAAVLSEITLSLSGLRRSRQAKSRESRQC